MHEPNSRQRDPKPCSAFCLSALRGGGGKTFVSLGLARLFAKQGFYVQPFKKGPDYIDAAWLGHAAGVKARHLDLFFLSPDALADCFSKTLDNAPTDRRLVALIEGNRGLFDGLDSGGSCSTAEVAKAVGTPILFVLDCTKMTRTSAAILLGLTGFDPSLSFCGVIANNVGTARQGELIREVLSLYTDIPLLGVLPRLRINPLPERHMGIASFGEELSEDLCERLDGLAAHIAHNVDTATLLALTERVRSPQEKEPAVTCCQLKSTKQAAPRIGVIRDAAFWFYYEENLEALEAEGAQLLPLSLLSGDGSERVWESLDGLYIGGGFPEDYAQALAKSPALERIRSFSRSGRPVYAECGGFMLLARSLIVGDNRYAMAGLFPLDVTFCAIPQGLGYIEGIIVGKNPYYPEGFVLRGHEFHYSRPLETQSLSFALQLSRGSGMTGRECALDGLVMANTWASYTHIYAPALPCWAKNFVSLASSFRQNAPE